MADEDYYKVLEIPRSATEAEIQKAYRRLAKKYHPDLHEDKEKAKQQFQRVQAAYDVLGDEEKRKLYDRFGPQFEQMRGATGGGAPFGAEGTPFGGMDIDFSQLFGNAAGGAQGRGRGPRGGGGFGAGGLEDLFRHFGGGGAGRGPAGDPRAAGQQAPSLDHVLDITVSFATAVMGGEHRITLDRGGKPESITARIPKGIESGKKIRLREQGHIGRDGRRGDLFLRINVAPHPFFRRNGLHLMVTVPITLSEALLGTKADLPTPHGTVALTIPPGSSSGRVLRMKGMGVRTEKASGDLLAELEVVVPENLTDTQREALRRALESIPMPDPRSELKW